MGHPADWPNIDIQFLGHTERVMSVAFSPDATRGRIVSGSFDKTVRVWDAEKSIQIGAPLEGHTQRVSSVAFSPDGTRIVSGSDDKTVRVWDAERGVQISSPLQGHTHWVTSVRFSSNKAHSLCDSQMLFQCLPSKEWNMECSPMPCKDGWVRGPNSELILWVPHVLQKPFYSIHNTLVIPQSACIELDLSKMAHGNKWTMCFGPFSSRSMI
ncbi:hypothetical protein ID866_5976 [Astraeus odoratus]|nr:hypothetical protein ID866_5976 [Astraeus odoratus]